MKRILIYCMITVCCLPFAKAQVASDEMQNISVTSVIGEDPYDFILRSLVGSGVRVFNVQFNGSSDTISQNQIGIFHSNEFHGFAMDSGIVMTTGSIQLAPGPNMSTLACDPEYNYYSDPEISSVVSGRVCGCSTLDFDFVSLTDEVSFSYTFASEEYPEFVCSSFNDAFAFLVTGTDPVTGETRTRNVATIPGTISDEYPDGIPVAINTVNGGERQGNDCFSEYYQYYRSNPSEMPGVEYDGYTMKMMATTNLVPCEVYHMHLSVCNIGDNGYDSGVFLEFGSFSSPEIQMGFGQTADSVRRLGWGFDHELPLDISQTRFNTCNTRLSFGGSAQYGVDYECYAGGTNPLPANGGYVLLNAAIPTNLILSPLHDSTFTGEKTVELYFETMACPGHNTLLARDTIHIALVPHTASIDAPDLPGVRVYPNPADDRIEVEADQLRSVEIYTTSGTRLLEIPCGSDHTVVNTDTLAPGFYIVKVITAQGTASRNLIVQ